jgi:hypothetical protein
MDKFKKQTFKDEDLMAEMGHERTPRKNRRGIGQRFK